MSQFSQLIDEIQWCAPEPVRHNPRAPSRSIAIPKAVAAQSGASLLKALDGQLSSFEALQRSLGAQIQKAALDARIVNLRHQAAELIERANGDMLKAIAAGELGSQEAGERQILLNAFAHRMGLS